MEHLCPLEDDSMSISMEILVKARNFNLNMCEVPISCLYHSESSTLNPVLHGLSVALSTIKQRLKFALKGSNYKVLRPMAQDQKT